MTGHRARKRFGQNFLVDQGIINQIIHCINPEKTDRMLEIGPGQGALTGPLLHANPYLQVVELDRDLIPILLAQFAKYKHFKIHQSDALKFDFRSLANQPVPSDSSLAGNLRVVGNLPYNISTPLIFKLLESRECINDMHFMLQKEVVNRLVASPGEKNYGRLSIMSQYYCNVECLFDVPPESFDPAPKVNSAIVRLSPHQELPHPAKNMRNLDRLVKTAFQQRRKTLRNGLKMLVSDEQAETVGMDLSLRAERLSIRDYVNFSNALWGNGDIPETNE